MFRFKECRENANLTQKEAAISLGVSIQSISNWENGIRRPSLEQLLKIADLYSVTVDSLLGRQNVKVTVNAGPSPTEPPPGYKMMEIDLGAGTADMAPNGPEEQTISGNTNHGELHQLVASILEKELKKRGL